MSCTVILSYLGWLVAATGPCPIVDAPADGRWKMSYLYSAAAEIDVWIVRLKSDGSGRLAGDQVAANPRLIGTSLERAELSAGQLRLVFKTPRGEQTFEGPFPPRERGTLWGTFDDGRRLHMARLVRTEDENLDQAESGSRRELPELVKRALELSGRSEKLRYQAQQARKQEERSELMEQAAQAAKEARQELPKLHQQVLTDHPDDPAVFDSAVSLFRSAGESGAGVESVRRWAEAARTAAGRYGARWETEVMLRTAEALGPQTPYAAVALDFARQAEEGLRPADPPAPQARALKALALCQERAGQADAARQTRARLERFEEALDNEYRARLPDLKPEPFGGRKGTGERAVVLELFTGAQGPPCAAAQFAFDALTQAYGPRELIPVEYHVHIPGPDPLTNPESEERWAYYRKDFAQTMRGTPSTVFNGKPAACGGGFLAHAPNKLAEYRQAIDPLLETPAAARLAASAVRDGDRVQVRVEVIEARAPAPTWRLRLVLTEETVRYVGGNGLRLHHYVARAMLGGSGGVPVPAAGGALTAAVDLAELRDRLAQYLDDYAAQKRPFANPDRPLRLEKLRLVALVQDDATKEIIQGIVTDVATDTGRSP
jgi:hypothetical protein